MRRREFITVISSAAAWPLVASAQQHERVRRLGVLMSVEEGDAEGKAQLSGFTQALAQLGWTDGQNLRMEIRWGGGGDVNRARIFAKELVDLQPDVILAQGTPVTAALQRETRTIPHCICCSDRSGRGRVRCRTIASGREYNGLLDV